MTSEVVVMNQHALVLAADSATTVTHWSRGEKQVRYFKGANKLFQLSAHHPVGLMIYGSASLHSVPWELLVKEFRADLGTESCDKLSGYPQKFCEFLKGHSALFPDSVRKQALLDAAMVAAYAHAHETGKAPAVNEAGENQEHVYREHLKRLLGEAQDWTPEEPLTKEDVDAAVLVHRDEVRRRIDANPDDVALDFPDLSELLAEIALRSALVHYTYYLDSTGVVIGGYGDDDYFPSFEVMECYGFLDQHFLIKRLPTSRAVTRESPAAIEPFATTSMINTFRMGIGPDVFGNVVSATQRTLEDFARELVELVAPGASVPDLEERIARFAKAHVDEWFDRTWNDHYGPLARVIRSLPVSDMAALAKSLIELQSLKERVTQPSESVGGPIDVAVISKHDGFVWIERKHYFRPELNPRFFVRQRQH